MSTLQMKGDCKAESREAESIIAVKHETQAIEVRRIRDRKITLLVEFSENSACRIDEVTFCTLSSKVIYPQL